MKKNMNPQKNESHMFVVIFSAQNHELDDTYAKTAARLREQAPEKYGCLAFRSVSDGVH